LVEHALEVAAEIGKIERPGVILGVAVAARIPGHGAVAPRERFDLPVPVVPVAADAVQEEYEGPGARDRERNARLRADEDRFDAGYSTRAPEIFTARARLALSVLRNASKVSGELPTTS
jgi:hypothetical protein